MHPAPLHTAALANLPATASKQSGFSLVEVSIVTAIVLIISIIGIPAINSYVVENKVPKVAGELQRYAARTKANAQGSSAPYSDLDTENLARALRNSSVLAVDPALNSTVAHGLGGNGSTSGLVQVASAQSGAAFTITMDAVNDAACPALASMMQRVSGHIAVGGATPVVVKDAQADPIKHYSALDAEDACETGDVNRFIFTVW